MYTFHSLDIFTGSLSEFSALMDRAARTKSRIYVCVAGVHGMGESVRDRRVRDAYAHASYIVPDGMPLVWMARTEGHPETKRIYGPDLMWTVCRDAERNGYEIFLYGSSEQTLKRLSRRISEGFPHLRVAGTLAPPYRPLTPQEENRVAGRINESGASIVFVGISTPKQELWMRKFRPLLRPPVIIGVGAAFDFLAGTKRQAPHWVRRSGMEWLFRLLQEPGRLFPRYAVSGPVFLWLALRQMGMHHMRATKTKNL